jgi:hypothetical protein
MPRRLLPSSRILLHAKEEVAALDIVDYQSNGVVMG